MTVDELAELLATGTRSQVMTGLLALTDSERKQLGPKARRWLTHYDVAIAFPRLALAVVATSGGARQATQSVAQLYAWDREFIEDAVLLLRRRAPAWLPDLVRHLLDGATVHNWRLVHSLVRTGAVAAPEHPEYFRGTVFGFDEATARDRVPLVDRVRQDPHLTGDHLVTMLASERAGRALTTHDGYQESSRYLYAPEPFPDGTWRNALVALQESGEVDRQRLLDVVLAAPLRDWAAANLGWYVGMHDALAPTVDEVVIRQATYARLLTVEHGPSVKVAQRAILRILTDERCEPGAILDASAATLGRSDKAIVAAQLRLLAKLAPAVDIAGTVRIAADHPRADIRAQAAKLLERLGVDEPAEPLAPFSVPVPQPRPVVDRVPPVAGPDELGEVLLGLLEDFDPVEAERAIDGLLRFADARPHVADLLLRRTTEAQYGYGDPRVAAAVLARAWLVPRKRFRDGEWPIILGHKAFPAEPAAPETFVGALGRRLTGVAQAIRRGPHPSVSLPSHRDGSLDKDVLTKRLRAGHKPLELEVAVALLRVAPADRAHVDLPSALRRSRLVERVLALGSPEWQRQVVSHRHVEWQPEQRVLVFGDRTGNGGLLPRPHPERTLTVELDYGAHEPRFEQSLAFGALMLPHDPDILAAHAHPYLHRDLTKELAVSVPVLDALARSRTVNGAPASSALVLGLGAKDARARTAAQDALLDRARHGGLDGHELGSQATLVLRDDLVVGKRLVTGLGEAVRASDTTVKPILDALQRIVAVLPGRRDAGAFLELTADLAERTGRRVELPAELRALGEGKAGSLAAKAVRRLRY